MTSLPYIISAVFLLVLICWLIYLETRLKKFFKGSSGKDLESVLVSVKNEMIGVKEKEKEQEERLNSMEGRLKKSIQHVNTVRFNPFEDSGSNQSFAVALLDEKGDGVALSSLYSRDKVGIYAKPIKEYQSEFPLSEEEKAVIKKSKENG